MTEKDAEIVNLLSVTLTRDKSLRLEKELEKYAKAVNWVIRTIIKRRSRPSPDATDELGSEFRSKFDSRLEYYRDIVKTARVTIGQHKQLARIVRSMRHKMPSFEQGKMIFSAPLVEFGHKGVTLFIDQEEPLPIPFDKRSRNQHTELLDSLAKNKKPWDRVRFTWHKEGFLEIGVRII